MHTSCIAGLGIASAAALAPWLWLAWRSYASTGSREASRDLIPAGIPEAVAEVARDGLTLTRAALAAPDLKPRGANQISLDGNDHLLVRLHLAASPGSLVIKRFGHNMSLRYAPMQPSMHEVLLRLDSYRHPSLDFQREAEALRLLNNTLAFRGLAGWGMTLAPLFYGSSASSGTLVMQDLVGSGETLCHLLGVVFKGGTAASSSAAGRKQPTPEAVSFAFARIGEVLARIHSPEFRGFHESAFLRNITMGHDSELFSSSVAVVRSLLERAGVTIPDGFSAETAEVARSLSDPGMWLSLTHGDVCADNVWLMNMGGDVEPMMIDYSSAGLRHCLADLAAVLLLFPTCWCVGDVPWPLMERVLSRYRHARLVELEGREEHQELYAALLDEAAFNANLMRMASFHLLVLLSEYWNDAQQNLQCGHVPCRAHIMTRLSVYLKLASQRGGGGGQPAVGAIHSMVQKLQQGLQKAWPEARLPAFPTFGKLDRTRISQSAAREEERRLRVVSHADVLHRAGGAAAPPYKQLPQVQAQGASPLAALSRLAQLPREPTIILNSSLAAWPGLRKWTSLVEVAKSARPDMRWTIKTVTLGSGSPPGPPLVGARFPLGCCRTLLVNTTELLRDGSRLLDGGSTAAFYASVVVSGEPGILGEMPEVSDLAVAARANQSSITNIWAGSRGSIAPLHYDPFHNVVLQVAGRKRFLLASPAASKHLYLHPRLHLRHRQAQLNINDIDRLRFGAAKELRPGRLYVATLEPGECLYLPPFWFHQVEALETALSLSVFSGDVHSMRADPAWEVPVPSGFGSWATEQLTSYAALYVRTMLQGLLPDEAPAQVFERVLATRYEAGLYGDELSPKLEVLQPAQGEVADPHVVQYALDTAAEEAGTCWIGCCGRGCKAAAAAQARFCRAGQDFQQRQAAALLPIVAPRARAIKAQVAERSLGSGALRIMVEDFIEDVAAMAVGETQVYAFLKSCRW